jgi:hypothetical protein
LDITPFREDLQYSKRTHKVLLDKFNAIIDEVRKTVEDKVKNAKNYYDACSKYVEWLTGDNQDFVTICQLTNVTWQGKKLEESVDIKPFHVNRILMGHNGRAKAINRHNYRYQYGSKVDFHWNDMKTGAVAAARRAVEDGTSKEVYVLTFDDDAQRQKFTDAVGFDDTYLVKSSSLPKVARQKRGKQGNAFEYDKTKGWEQTAIDLSKGGYYTHYRGGYLDMKGRNTDYRTLENDLNEIGAKLPTNFYGVHANTLKKMEALKNWHHLDVYMTEQLEKFVAKEKILDLKAAENTGCGGLINKYTSLTNSKTPLKQQDVLDLIDRLKNIKIAQSARNKMWAADSLARRIGYDLDSKVKATDIQAMEKKIQDKYPMLDFVEGYRILNAEQATKVVEYLNSI